MGAKSHITRIIIYTFHMYGLSVNEKRPNERLPESAQRQK